MAAQYVTSVIVGPQAFYGRGVSTPFRLDSTGSRPAISENEDLVFESMGRIINTDPAERPFLMKNGRPYGTRCNRVMFESNEAVVIDIVVYEIKAALTAWEPRIIVDRVEAESVLVTQKSKLIQSITYFRFRATNRPDNLVVPFRYQPGGNR